MLGVSKAIPKCVLSLHLDRVERLILTPLFLNNAKVRVGTAAL